MPMRLRKTLPVGVSIAEPASASTHVLRSELRRYYPQAQTEYSYSTTNKIIFDISSPSSFVDFLNSYIRFKVTCTLNNNGIPDASRYIAETGAHSFFERLEIFTKSGTLIERIDDYNRLVSIFSTASQPRDYIETCLHPAGDSVEHCSKSVCDLSGKPLTGSLAASSGANVNLTTKTGCATLELNIGDLVKISDGTTTAVHEVTAVTNDDQFAVKPNPPANPTSIVILSSASRDVQSVRNKVANTADYKLCFQPFSSFLNNGNLIPLFLMRGGLRIELTLANPAFVLASECPPKVGSPATGTGFTGADVVIKNPEWLCHMLQPDQSLSDMYLQLYNAGAIQYMFTGYRRFQNIVGSGTGEQTLAHQSNVRSAKHILTRIQDQRARTVTGATVNAGKSTFTADSIAQGLAAGVSSYQIQSGSFLAPESTPLEVSAGKSEVATELMRVMGTLGVVLKQGRAEYHEFAESDGKWDPAQTGRRTDSQRLILSAHMGRDPSPFSGIDLSLNVLNEKINFGSAYNLTDSDGSSNSVAAQRYITSFIGFDSSVHISSEGVVVFS